MNLNPFLSEIVNFILIAIILNKIDNFLFSESTKDHLNVNRTLILPREAPGSVGKKSRTWGRCFIHAQFAICQSPRVLSESPLESL